MKRYIQYKEYLDAKKIVDDYESQLKQSIVKISDLSINQKVKRNYPESWYYWISEIENHDILIRTTEKQDVPGYDDFWVNIAEICIV